MAAAAKRLSNLFRILKHHRRLRSDRKIPNN